MSKNARRFVSAFTSPTSSEENTSSTLDSTALASGSACEPNARKAANASPAPPASTNSLRTVARCTSILPTLEHGIKADVHDGVEKVPRLAGIENDRPFDEIVLPVTVDAGLEQVHKIDTSARLADIVKRSHPRNRIDRARELVGEP